jgi:hypothetical protein
MIQVSQQQKTVKSLNIEYKRKVMSGVNIIKLFCPSFTNFSNKLECLSLVSLSSLV